MAIIFKIKDISSPSAKAFLEYVKTLDFVTIIKDDYVDLSEEEGFESNQFREKEIEYGIDKSHLEKDISESQLNEVELRRQNHLNGKSKSFTLDEVLANARNSKMR